MAGEMVEKTHGILDSFEETKVRRRHKSDSLLESTAVCGHANEQTVLNCKLTGIVANDFEADPKANALSKTSIGGESKPGTSENEVSFFHLLLDEPKKRNAQKFCSSKL